MFHFVEAERENPKYHRLGTRSHKMFHRFELGESVESTWAGYNDDLKKMFAEFRKDWLKLHQVSLRLPASQPPTLKLKSLLPEVARGSRIVTSHRFPNHRESQKWVLFTPSSVPYLPTCSDLEFNEVYLSKVGNIKTDEGRIAALHALEEFVVRLSPSIHNERNTHPHISLHLSGYPP